MTVQRIAILGAESSGKSTLSEALARHYGTIWVPEYLREFVDTHARVPYEEDQFGIARTQRAREDAAALQANRFLFCDTTPLMTALYSRVYWGRVDAQLAALDARHDYALTLVTAPDTPWEPDGLQRESEEVRQRVHQMLLDTLAARGIAYVLLEGGLPHRMRQVEALLGPA
ncbi:ATP-binding protein [Massilia sp. YIM B02443]|uniref:ATP-binding protein n=1 Tax=Massilia sp. YIM B02443 TaxID=3050127 RepID=UPI0025B6D725|nr:ATP-binding protein [Massilia sp. YIM B02443]MDN4038382.1 ATP-binding protein [Massilia sp. YIM B02443]